MELPAGQPLVTRHGAAQRERRMLTMDCSGADATTFRPCEGAEPSLQSLVLLTQKRWGLVGLPQYKRPLPAALREARWLPVTGSVPLVPVSSGVHPKF